MVAQPVTVSFTVNLREALLITALHDVLDPERLLFDALRESSQVQYIVPALIQVLGNLLPLLTWTNEEFEAGGFTPIHRDFIRVVLRNTVVRGDS